MICMVVILRYRLKNQMEILFEKNLTHLMTAYKITLEIAWNIATNPNLNYIFMWNKPGRNARYNRRDISTSSCQTEITHNSNIINSIFTLRNFTLKHLRPVHTYTYLSHTTCTARLRYESTFSINDTKTNLRIYNSVAL